MRKSDYPKVIRRGVAVMVIVLLLFGAFAPAAMAPQVWPHCTFSCNAQDFNVVDVYLGDANGDPLPPCNPGDVAARIWIKIDANTARYAIILLANITIDGVLEESFWDETPAGRCVADAIPGGISYPVEIYSFIWKCGEEVKLENVVLSWETSKNKECANANRACNARGQSKCYSSPDIIVHAPFVANFTFDKVCFCTYTQFTNKTTGGVVPYTDFDWDFGDDSPHSSEENPSHLYAAADTYTVTLTVTDSNTTPNTDSRSHDVEVYELPTCEISCSPSCEVCEGTTVTLDAGAGFSSYLWSTGESTQTIDVTTTDTYSVTVTDEHACEGTCSKDVTVYELPTCEISCSPSCEVCEGTTVTLDAGAGFSSYLWSTGESTQTIDVTTTDTYSVTVTDEHACEGTCSKDVTVYELPTCEISCSPSCEVCAGTTVTLDAGSGFSSYLWSTGESTQTIDVTTTDTYSVTVTDEHACEGTCSKDVTVYELPTCEISCSPSCEVCAGTTVTLDAGSGFSSYLWSTGESTQTIDVTTTDTYSVTVTDEHACEGTCSKDVTVYELPTCEISCSPSCEVCEGTTVTLDAGSGFSSYLWSTGESTQTIDVTTTDTYSVTVTDEHACEGTCSKDVTVYELPTCEISCSPSCEVCEGTTVTLDAGSGFSSYLWSTGESTQTIDVTTTDTYRVTVTDEHACEGTCSKDVTVYELPTCEISCSPSCEVCAGTTVTLDAGSGFSSYLWSTGESTQTIDVTTTDTYRVTVTDEHACEGTCSKDVTVYELPTCEISCSPSCEVCEGTTVTLDAGSGFSSYLWSTGESTQTIDVTTTDTYRVTVTDEHACEGTCSKDVTVYELPTCEISCSPSCEVCEGTTVTLDAGSGFSSYLWSTGESTQTIDVTTTDTYRVTVTDEHACEGTCSKDVTVYELPTCEISCSPSCEVCAGTTVTLDAGSGFSSYLWSTGESTQTIDVTTTDTYRVTVTDEHACEGTCSKDVTVYELPTCEISCSPSCEVCAGTTVTLDAGSGFSSYLWSTGESTQTIDVTTTDTYRVTVTDEHACEGTCSKDVTVYELPTCEISCSPSCEVCEGTTVTLDAGSGFSSYLWSTGESTQTIDVTTTDTYRVTVTDEHACEGTCSKDVTVYELPTCEISCSPSCEVCEGTTVTLDAGSGFSSYLWSTGESTQTIDVTTTDTYRVTVTDEHACEGTCSKDVTVYELPTCEISCSPSCEVCEGTTVTLDAGSGFSSYLWSTGESTQTIDVTTTDTYRVTVTDEHACEGTCSKDVTVYELPTCEISCSPSCEVCAGTTVTLDAGSGFSSYLWSTGESTQTIDVTTTDTYRVTVTDEHACEGTCSKDVTVYELPTCEISCSPSCEVCEGTTVTLDAGSGFSSYLWSTGESTQTIDVTTTDTYRVTVTDEHACEGTCSKDVTVYELPTCEISCSPSCEVCEGTTVTLDAGSGFSSYLWSTGESTQTIDVTTTDTYRVTVTDEHACEGTCSKDVTVYELPTCEISCSPSCEVCAGTTVTLDAGSGFSSYLWSTGESTQTIDVTTTDTYRVTVTDEHACEGTCSKDVTVYELPTCEISCSPSCEVCEGTTVTLDAGSGFSSYLWSTGESTQTIDVTTTDTYRVTVTDEHACEGTCSKDVTVYELPTCEISCSPSCEVCEGTTVTLDAGSGFSSYLWSTGESTQTIDVTTTDTYRVTVTDEHACEGTCSKDVTVYELPTCEISCSPSCEVCEGTTVTLDAGSGFSSYLWSTGESTQTIDVTTTDTYRVTVTDEHACEGTCSKDVTVYELPTCEISCSPSCEVCEGTTVTLDAGSGFSSYLWSTGESTQTIDVTTTDTYRVTVTDEHACEGTCSKDVTVYELPTCEISCSPSCEVCEGTTVTLDAGSGFSSYLWSTGESTQTIDVTTTDTYRVTVTDEHACEGTCSKDVTVYELPTCEISCSPSCEVCEGTTVTLDAGSGFSSYLWSTGESTQTIDVTTTDTYRVTVTDEHACEGTCSKDVTVYELPTCEISCSPSCEVCEGTTVTLDAGSGFSSYLWSTGESTQTIDVTTTDTYRVTVTDEHACEGTCSKDVTVYELPTCEISCSPSCEVCAGTTVTLDAGSGFSSYLWSTGESTQTIDVTTTDTYRVTVTDEHACEGTCSKDVTVYELPTCEISCSPSCEVCAGTTVTLDAGSGFSSYLWSTGESTQTIDVTTTDTYRVTVTDEHACEGTCSKDVTVYELPTCEISCSPSCEVCEGTTVTLDAGSGFSSYLWSTGESTQTIDVTTTDTYRVTVTDEHACEGTCSKDVTVYELPTCEISCSPSCEVCAGTTVTLDAGSGFSSYLWSTGESTQTIDVTTTDTYRVTVTDEHACEGTCSKDVTVYELPTCEISCSPSCEVCEGTTVTLDAGSGFSSYLWSTGESTQTIDVTTTDTYRVTVTDEHACEGTCSKDVTVYELPTCEISCSPSCEVCEGTTVTLDAGAGFSSYLWSTGESTQTIDVTTTDTYRVTVTDEHACEGTCSKDVTVYELPTCEISCSPSCEVCEGTTVTLDAGSGFSSYLWSTGESTQTIDVTTTDTYRVTVTDEHACEGTCSKDVTVYELPTCEISCSPSCEVCEGTTVTLDAGAGFSSYLWSTGETTQTIDVTTTDTYRVTVTDEHACEGTCSKDVTVYELPTCEISCSPSCEVCEGTTVTLDAGAGFSSYLWSTGETTQTIDVTTTDTYRVTVTDADGCENTCTKEVTFYEAGIEVDKTAAYALCPFDARLPAKIGDTVTYRFKVTNTGDLTLTRITVSDDLYGPVAIGTTTLAPGESTKGKLTHVVVEDDYPSVTDTATATGTDPSGRTVTDTDECTVLVRLE